MSDKRLFNIIYARPVLNSTGQTVAMIQMSEIIDATGIIEAIRRAEANVAVYSKQLHITIQLQAVGEIPSQK